MKLRSPDNAFTLIELLIVVAIIAILAAIAVPNFLEAQVRAKVSREKTDLRTLATAVESYCIDQNAYPLHGRITDSDAVEEPAQGAAFMDLNEFALPILTTPVAYSTSLLSDPFADHLVGPLPQIEYYDYINLRYHLSLPGAPPAPIAQSFIDQWGPWRMSGCGPDMNRGEDTKNNIIYDPTNGTVSEGDIVRCQLRSESVPHP